MRIILILGDGKSDIPSLDFLHVYMPENCIWVWNSRYIHKTGGRMKDERDAEGLWTKIRCRGIEGVNKIATRLGCIMYAMQ